ncbi:MAG: hypothetical protein HYY34_07465, partial [Chloroflexi bacterium]|nr:hypothetical protein [Chloroflexota bacterium]
ILAIAVLFILAVPRSGAARAKLSPGIVVAGMAAVIVLGGWVLSMVGHASTTGLIAQALAIAAAMVVMAITARWQGWRRWWLLCVTAAYIAASAHFLARFAGSAAGMSGALLIAEVTALSAAALTPFVWRVGSRPRVAALAFGVAILWAGFAASQPHIARFLVIWDLGLSSPLPLWAFAIALAGLVYGVVGGRSRPAAVGFAVVALAGLRLDNTYFALLSLAGFAVLTAGHDPAHVLTIPSRPGARDSRLSHAAERNWRHRKAAAS